MPKILLFCPTYERDGLDMFWPDSQDAFNALLAPEGVEVVRVVGRDNPYPLNQFHRYRNALHQFQNAQRMALEGGYDALVTFETDMIAPADGLIKLWNTPADVVHALYLLRHGSNVVNAFRWIEGSPNIDQSVSLFLDLYRQGLADGFLRISGCGNGFVLIRRGPLERFPFRAVDNTNFAPDWAFATDCQAAGVLQVCRFDTVCGHIEDDGHILWPGLDGRYVKIRAHILQDFTGIDDDTTHVYTAGMTVEISNRWANEYKRAGFLEILPQDNDGLIQLARPRRPIAVETATLGAPETAVSPRGKKGRTR